VRSVAGCTVSERLHGAVLYRLLRSVTALVMLASHLCMTVTAVPLTTTSVTFYANKQTHCTYKQQRKTEFRDNLLAAGPQDQVPGEFLHTERQP
jgi:hypothetical protein